MAKKLNDWLDEFVENGADASDVVNWPENTGGGENTISRTFKVSADIQCYWRDLTFVYDSDDTTPSYNPQYDEETSTWVGIEGLIAHLKEVLADGKEIYGYGYGDDPFSSEYRLFPYVMKWYEEDYEGHIEGVGIYEMYQQDESSEVELSLGTYIQSDGMGLWPESTISDSINED